MPRRPPRSLSPWLLVAGLVTILLPLSGIPGLAAADREPRPLLRFPDIHEDTVVFVHGEDLWKVPASGGVAIRLTLDDGEERFPSFSPDGSVIAFTAEIDGNPDVYVMDTDGGGISRVTWHPGADEVVGWHPTRNRILFRSARRSFSRFTRLFLVHPDGSGLEEVPLHEAAHGSYSPDGSRIAYNRTAREFRTWKRYRGGTAQEVRLYDLDGEKESNLTRFAGTDRRPMWIGDRVYFSSDRDRVLNLYAADPATGEVEKLTDHRDYDVRRPSAGGNRIVYEIGGELWLLDVTTRKTRRIPVEIRADAPEARVRRQEVNDLVTQFDVSPSGKRALLVARGDVFTVPREHGPTRNLTRSSGSRERGAVWSPDGTTVAFVSDAGGEYGIWLADPLGERELVELTRHEDGYRHSLGWSPDGSKIAFADQTLRLHYVDVESGEIIEVDRATHENVDVALDRKPIFDYAWSPDSRFLAYSVMNADLVYNILVYSLDTGERFLVSEGLFNDFGPVFSPDGEHLLFVSNRRFDPTYGDFEWEMVYKKVAGIYAVTLRRDGPAFLPHRSDEAPGGEKGPESATGDSPRVRIDPEGIAARTQALPLPRGNYRDLAVTDSTVFYLDAEEGDFNRFDFRSLPPRALHAFDREDRDVSDVAEGVSGYRLSSDGSWLLYRQGDAFVIERHRSWRSSTRRGDGGRDRSSGGRDRAEWDDDGEHELDLSGLEVRLDPRAEWKQIFREAWRMERDFYYEPGMHGVDWEAMRVKYESLIERASCRQDVRYIVGELIGELNTSHTYVYGGDRSRRGERLDVGMLGADWEPDPKANRYRLAKIFRVPDWTRDVVPPLASPGVDAREGDFLLRVNGTEVTTDRNLYSYFQGLAGEQVTLLLNDRPSDKGARRVTVLPLRDERVLRYLDWVENNRRIAEERSGGRIGYLHLPDTYNGSAREFPKYFYAQTRKQGLVVDGRFNGGGLDPHIFLHRLDRAPMAYFTRRYSHDQTIPPVVNRSHKVLLTNYRAGSGGDMLPMEFRMMGMGPVIGTRTWGGLVGVSMFLDLVDGGGLTAPDYRIYDTEGRWIVENEGVTPDIEVDLHPAEMARGYDAQLEKAIEVLLQRIEQEPRQWPQHDPYPVDQ